MIRTFLLFTILGIQTPIPLPAAQTVQPTILPQAPQQPPPVSGSTNYPGVIGRQYRLGPGDTIEVSVWTGREYLEEEITLAADGSIFIPFFANRLLQVDGKNSLEVRDMILEEVQANFRDPVVQVVMKDLQSKKATLAGEVYIGRGGTYPITGETRVLEFVIQNGGYNANANLAGVQVSRATGERLTVNFLDMLIRADMSKNILVEPNDLVYLPGLDQLSNKYFITGEVGQPQVLQTAEALTLFEAVTEVGFFLPSANADSVFVIRVAPVGDAGQTETLVHKVRLSEFFKKGNLDANMPLQSGDIVYVPKNRIANIQDVAVAVAPIMNFLRDTIFFGALFRRDGP